MTRSSILCTASAAWCGVVIAICRGGPCLFTRLPDGVQAGLPWVVTGVTGILILANTCLVLRRWLARGKRAAVLPSMILVEVLFGVQFVAVYALFGTEHYRCSATPGPEDWAAFTAAHAVRGADALDVAEELNLRIQAVHYNSDLVRGMLIAFNLVNGFLVLDLVGRLVRQAVKAVAGDTPHLMVAVVVRAVSRASIAIASLIAAYWTVAAVYLTFVATDVSGTDLEARQVGWKIAAGLWPGIAAVFVSERLYHRWVTRRYGALPAFVTTNGEDLATPRQYAFIGWLAVLLPAVLLSVAGLGAAILGAMKGVDRYGAEAIGTWALVNIIQAADLADVMIIYSLRPFDPGDFDYRPALALVIRGTAVLILSAIVAGLARWWTRRPDDDPGDRLRPSLEGLWGLVTGSVIAAAIVTGTAWLVAA